MMADPICRRHVMGPACMTARFAQRPRKIPNAVHICQLITNAPRIDAGAHSAAKIDTVAAFNPIPRPSKSLETKSCSQV